ncbi:MAG: putative actin patch assembly and actin polymerization protein [Thelocarpon superellum]|nr:MAG: putative actin patch assembly and actin polymerization protein [Thelocarpon superellum]
MFGSQKKPYTAITVQVENLTSEQYDENDLSGIVDLIEVIRLQSSGPTEAARALRKKLKYGNVHRQLRALTILDGLIQNAGVRFQRVFADEPLLERLRFAATEDISDPEVKAKCQVLFRQWAVSYKSTPGMERVAALSKQLPQRKKPPTQQQSKVLRETEEDARRDMEEPSSPPPFRGSMSTTITSEGRPRAQSATASVSSPTSPSFFRSKKDKTRNKPFNIDKEKPQLLQTLASSSVASTNLLNSLKLINRENQRVSDDAEVMKRFETCKLLRRQILRYIQNVDSEQWLGGLIHANDELVTALMAFEVLDKSVELDSDSEDDASDEDGAFGRPRQASNAASSARHAFAGLTIDRTAAPPRPPRPLSQGPMSPSFSGKQRAAFPSDEDKTDEDEEVGAKEEDEDEDEDEDDPFADRNAVNDPPEGRPGTTW